MSEQQSKATTYFTYYNVNVNFSNVKTQNHQMFWWLYIIIIDHQNSCQLIVFWPTSVLIVIALNVHDPFINLTLDVVQNNVIFHYNVNTELCFMCHFYLSVSPIHQAATILI